MEPNTASGPPIDSAERDFSTKKRQGMDLSDFGDPDKRAFPVLNQEDLDNAARLLGHADNPAAVKKRLISIAKRKGLSLPDSWKDDAKESAFAPATLGNPTIATLVTTFIEDGAVSLNGRQYPASAVDRLIQSAQLHLSTPNAPPLTCYISHEAADRDDSLKLAGKITNVWREGAKGKARIALVNTEAGRTMATQAIGGFLRTMSLRASNAEIQRTKDGNTPIVGGNSLNLDGIDFTATPGLEVAKIDDVALAENASGGPQRLREVFHAQAPLLEMEQKGSGMDRLNEADQGGNTVGGYTPTSGNSPSMAGAPSGGAYGQRMYQAPPMTSGPMAGMDNAGRDMDLVESHDRIAMVQGRSCAPQRESARWNAAMKTLLFEGLTSQERQLIEAGRAINARNNKLLDSVHDTMARKTGMACEGKQNKMGTAPASDGMNDGDDDDYQSARPQGSVNEQRPQAAAPAQAVQPPKEPEHVTPEEAAKLLEAAGYKVEKPKTAEELQQERLAEQARQIEELKAEQTKQLAALQEQQNKKLAEMQQMIAQSQPDPQRRSVVLGSNISEASNGQHRPLRGKYLQEKIKNLDWERMANDRLSPLPTDVIPLDLLMREFEHMYALSYDDWAKRVYNIAPVYDSNR